MGKRNTNREKKVEAMRLKIEAKRMEREYKKQDSNIYANSNNNNPYPQRAKNQVVTPGVEDLCGKQQIAQIVQAQRKEIEKITLETQLKQQREQVGKKEEYIKQQPVKDLKKELLHLATQINQANNLELFLIRKRQAARLKASINHLQQQDERTNLALELDAIENILNQKQNKYLHDPQKDLGRLFENINTSLKSHMKNI